jgi:dGTPase
MKNIFEISKEICEKDDKNLFEHATLNSSAFRKFAEKEVRFRPAFALDRDRILYSGAFRRYTGKTQVVYFASMLDEQLSSRSIHTISVAQISRTIGRLLNLNVDLIEAIALGHDLGHPPFGHDGEKYLSEVSEKFGIKRFHHNIQSLRVVDVIAKNGQGLNLTFQVREGLLSHDGEVHNQKLIPQVLKTENDLFEFIEAKESGNVTSMMPMTMEGCVVRITDTIAYIGQDIEDAIRIGLITRNQIPQECSEILGNNNGAIIESLVQDVVENSYKKKYICFGEKISDVLFKLKRFNYKYIYKSKELKINHERIKRGFEILFKQFVEDIENNNYDSFIFKDFLNGKSKSYLASTYTPLKVRDYISGMTDRYFTFLLKKIIIPEISLGELDKD